MTREIEVLVLLAEGKTMKEIAEAICTSVSTVRNHTQHVLIKLNVHSRLKAVALRRRFGLILTLRLSISPPTDIQEQLPAGAWKVTEITKGKVRPLRVIFIRQVVNLQSNAPVAVELSLPGQIQ